MKATPGGKGSAVFMLLFFLLLFSLQLHAQLPDGLKVTIKASDKPLHNILDDLTQQTGYYFTFDSRLTDSHEKHTIELAGITIREAIDTLFGVKNLQYTLINNNIVIFPARKIPEENSQPIPGHKPSPLVISGKILDERSEKPLSYATIGIRNTYYGTISNEDGSFTLRIPDTIHQPILVCSFIGYKNYYVPIGANSEEALTISMQRNVISLQEVIIRYKDPVTLLNETMSRIPENYLSEPSGVTAYYREKVTKDDRCMIFSEAVVEISKSAYSGNKSADRLRVLKARKISNIVLEDTVVMKIRSGANTTLQLDIIKNPPDFLSPDFMIAYNLSFSNVVMYKDRLVYVISFSQKEGISEPLFRGDLYIDRGSLAIIAADFEYDPVLLRQDPEMFVAKKSSRLKVVPLNASYHVEYAQLNNIYHLSQVQGNLNFKVRKRREWIASRYHVSIEMAVTDVRPGLPPEIRYNEQMKPSTILSDEEFSYDPEFWGDYTTITPEAKLEDALQNIEKSLLEISEQVISIPAPGLN